MLRLIILFVVFISVQNVSAQEQMTVHWQETFSSSWQLGGVTRRMVTGNTRAEFLRVQVCNRSNWQVMFQGPFRITASHGSSVVYNFVSPFTVISGQCFYLGAEHFGRMLSDIQFIEFSLQQQSVAIQLQLLARRSGTGSGGGNGGGNGGGTDRPQMSYGVQLFPNSGKYCGIVANNSQRAQNLNRYCQQSNGQAVNSCEDLEANTNIARRMQSALVDFNRSMNMTPVHSAWHRDERPHLVPLSAYRSAGRQSEIWGQSFLKAHGDMLIHLNEYLRDRGLPCIYGRYRLEPTRRQMMPIHYDLVTNSNLRNEMDQSYAGAVNVSRQVLAATDLPLGVYAQGINVGFHFGLHSSLGRRDQTDDILFPSRSTYDPYFWSHIHTAVDYMGKTRWLRDSGRYSEFSENCNGTSQCYQWGQLRDGSRARLHLMDHSMSAMSLSRVVDTSLPHPFTETVTTVTTADSHTHHQSDSHTESATAMSPEPQLVYVATETAQEEAPEPVTTQLTAAPVVGQTENGSVESPAANLLPDAAAAPVMAPVMAPAIEEESFVDLMEDLTSK